MAIRNYFISNRTHVGVTHKVFLREQNPYISTPPIPGNIKYNTSEATTKTSLSTTAKKPPMTGKWDTFASPHSFHRPHLAIAIEFPPTYFQLKFWTSQTLQASPFATLSPLYGPSDEYSAEFFIVHRLLCHIWGAGTYTW